MNKDICVVIAAVVGVVLMVAAAPAVASTGASTSIDDGQRPSVLIELHDDAEHSEAFDKLCDRSSIRFSVACSSYDDAPSFGSDHSGPFRYRFEIDPVDDDAVSVRIDGRHGETSVRLVDSRLEFDDGIDPDRFGEALESNLIEPSLTQTTQRTPTSGDHWRNAFWQSMALMGGTIWYLIYDDLNALDWDYSGLFARDPDLDLRPQSEVWRNFGGWRFDDNMLFVNTPLHSMAGAGYYLLARGAHLGMWQSILVTNLSSFVWEAGVEHQEVISLNDLMFTNLGGIPLGEFYHQMGRFFRSAEPNPFNRMMSWMFATPMEIHDLLDGTGPLYAGERDARGWPVGTWQRFELQPSFGASMGDDAQTRRLDVGIDGHARLIRLPDYRAEAEHNEWVAGPLISQLSANIAADADSVYNWGLDGALDFAGFHHQNISEHNHRLTGRSLFTGLSLGVRHYQHRYGDVLDRYGIVHLPGPVVDSSWLTDAVDLNARLSVHPDFYAIDSRAYPDYVEQTSRKSARTVLDEQRYYYGWGFSTLAALEAEMPYVRLHYGFNYHWNRSIDALDRFWDDEERFGEELDDYLQLTDRLARHELGATVPLWWADMEAGVVGQYRTRFGTLTDAGERWEDRVSDLRAMGVLRMSY